MANKSGRVLDRPKYFLIGLSRLGVTLIVGGNEIENLRNFAKNLQYYSIYRNKPGFWSSTQAEYLVDEDQDPLWRGPVH